MMLTGIVMPSASHTGNGTFSHPDDTSIARQTRNTVASSNGRPAICTPIGNPSEPNPTGTLIAGWPVTLNGIVCIGDAEDNPSTVASNRGAVASADAHRSAS